jgi:trehalose utilization protein
VSTKLHSSGPETLRVRVWCEGTAPRSIYPDDIDGAVAQGLQSHAELQVASSRLSDDDAGLGDAALDATDVLIWWGRLRHDEVPESRAAAVVDRVRAGKLGFVALHTSYGSKPFRSLMGMPCEPRSWHDEGRPEHVEIAAPEHPLARDVKPFVLPRTTMFLEPFAVPDPETIVLLSTWDGGPAFRSGLTWTRDLGRVVYLRPGDDSFPVLFHPGVRQLLVNAVEWAGRRT